MFRVPGEKKGKSTREISCRQVFFFSSERTVSDTVPVLKGISCLRAPIVYVPQTGNSKGKADVLKGLKLGLLNTTQHKSNYTLEKLRMRPKTAKTQLPTVLKMLGACVCTQAYALI